MQLRLFLQSLEIIRNSRCLSDVNVSGGLQNGMVLVFNAATNKFDATLELTPGTTQNLDINGGSF